MRVIFPGSFHPPTMGHIALIRRAARLFDEVIVAVMHNPKKVGRISPQERVDLLRTCLVQEENVRVLSDDGLLAVLCQNQKADAILRGLRTGLDYEYEEPLAISNRVIGAPETVFLVSDPAYRHISSTIVADIAQHGGPIEGFVPSEILARVRSLYAQ